MKGEDICYLGNVDFLLLNVTIVVYVVPRWSEHVGMRLDSPLIYTKNFGQFIWAVHLTSSSTKSQLTFVLLTLLPTSSFPKNRSILGPIFSYPGTVAWIRAMCLPSFSAGFQPEGKQHTYATHWWPSLVGLRRNMSSSTVVPMARKAADGSSGAATGC